MGSFPSRAKQSSSNSSSSDVGELTLSDFKIYQVLGQGSSGEVILARQKRHGCFALKMITRKPNQTPQDLRMKIQKEIKILKSLDFNCPFFVKYFGSFPIAFGTALTLEFVSGGNLWSKLQLEGSFTESSARSYIAQVSCGLESLRGKRIVHRDLKLDNILVTIKNQIKITDFGLATILIDGHATTKACGARIIRPPQMFCGEPYTTAADWYALGIDLYELIVGKHPFITNCEDHPSLENCDRTCLAKSVLRGEILYPSSLSVTCKDLLDVLLSRHERSRPKSLRDVIHHSWFVGVDWEKLSVGRID
ncbi:kinase-like domain-containing protein [Melampsora americana]|nr:kinase-like domain-containing protein [Melampsora americana]